MVRIEKKLWFSENYRSMGRFSVHYELLGDNVHVQKLAEWICLEQSVELPAEVLSDDIKSSIVGRIEALTPISENRFVCQISYPIQNVGDEVSQFLNVVFGNVSLVTGVRVIDVEWEKLTGLFRGPKYGIDGIRSSLGVSERPLSCTALKPMGFSPGKLGKLCYEFASGGLDIIKDDHGLANQSYAEFTDRVKACVLATKRAFEETGHQAWYFPNITADIDKVVDRYKEAYDLGAHGVLLSPHLSGLSSLNILRNHATPLPIMAHPAFSGALLNPNQGMTHAFIYGKLWRALGADFSIYPNYGGRFPFSQEECESINTALRDINSPFFTSFPTPGGGVQADTIPHWKKTYGNDTVFLIGGSLYKHKEGVRKASQEFVSKLG